MGYSGPARRQSPGGAGSVSGISEKRILRLHKQARKQQAEQMRLYRLIRGLLRIPFRLAFRPEVEGIENIPETGAALIASNHRSFFDSFFQALVLQRPIRWMAKSELFKYPGLDWLLVKLGAFPVRRGASDQEAILTAQLLLQAGEMTAVFPEGTRVREGLGEPKKGAARLALEAQAPIIPMAIVGTQKGVLRRSMWHQGEKVRISISAPIQPAKDKPASAAEITEQQLWPEVTKQVGVLESRRRKAIALGALSVMAGAGLIAGRKRRKR